MLTDLRSHDEWFWEVRKYSSYQRLYQYSRNLKMIQCYMFLTLVGDVHSEADHHVDQYCYHFHGPVGELLDPQRLHGLLEHALKIGIDVNFR